MFCSCSEEEKSQNLGDEDDKIESKEDVEMEIVEKTLVHQISNILKKNNINMCPVTLKINNGIHLRSIMGKRFGRRKCMF